MSDFVLKGPSCSANFPKQSIGITLYEEMTKKDPNKVAMADGVTDEQITYGVLLKASITLAVQLTQMDMKKGDVMAMVSENNWKYIAATISGYFLGVKIFFLNPSYTPFELKHYFSICKPKLIFCSNSSFENIAALKKEDFYPQTIINLDCDEFKGVKNVDTLLQNDISVDFHPTEVNPDDVAIIPTSSGTTGLPKCVLLSHANIRTVLGHFGDPAFIKNEENESTIANLPFFHMSGHIIVLTSIVYGVKLVVLPKFKPEQYLKTIEGHKITRLYTVPPLLLFLAKSPYVELYDISSVKEVICGAALMTKELQEMITKRMHVQSVRQSYGMAEITVGATMSPRNVHKMGTVGKPLPTNEIKVCHLETGLPLGPNHVGELRVKGGGLMIGYLCNEEATSQAFDSEGFLKTGDLGYYDEEEFFYIVDRLKDIIKYKAFQVSPAEIEYLLIQHPSVCDAAVIGVPDAVAGELPLAFVVKQSEDVTEEELVRYIAGKVCAQKHLYGGVRFVDEIPKSPSGKILRRKLREML